MKLIARWCLAALSLLVLAEVVPGISVETTGVAFVAALVIGILNVLVKPLVIILTLPVTVVTLGLFLFVINAAFFSIAATLVPGFTVVGWLAAMLGAIGMSLSSLLAQRIFK